MHGEKWVSKNRGERLRWSERCCHLISSTDLTGHFSLSSLQLLYSSCVMSQRAHFRATLLLTFNWRVQGAAFMWSITQRKLKKKSAPVGEAWFYFFFLICSVLLPFVNGLHMRAAAVWIELIWFNKAFIGFPAGVQLMLIHPQTFQSSFYWIGTNVPQVTVCTSKMAASQL